MRLKQGVVVEDGDVVTRISLASVFQHAVRDFVMKKSSKS